jgi:hypothetical protein
MVFLTLDKESSSNHISYMAKGLPPMPQIIDHRS